MAICLTEVAHTGELTIYSSVGGDNLKDFSTRFANALQMQMLLPMAIPLLVPDLTYLIFINPPGHIAWMPVAGI